MGEKEKGKQKKEAEQVKVKAKTVAVEGVEDGGPSEGGQEAVVPTEELRRDHGTIRAPSSRPPGARAPGPETDRCLQIGWLVVRSAHVGDKRRIHADVVGEAAVFLHDFF